MASIWETTSVPNLLRHKAKGRYYVRFAVNGKRKMASLKTDKISIAKVRVHKKLAEVQAQRMSGIRTQAGSAKMEDLIKQYREHFSADSELTPGGKRAREWAVQRLVRTWPGLLSKSPASISQDSIRKWANRIHTTEPVPVQPGARTRRIGYSANSVNQAIETLQRIFRIAVETGALHSTPFDSMSELGRRIRKRVDLRPVRLPSNEKTEEVFRLVESPQLSEEILEQLAARIRDDALDCGELVRGLAYSGLRLGEAARLRWEDLHPQVMVVEGTKTKSSNRDVPIIAPMRKLLGQMTERRKKNDWSLKGPVFRVKECQKSLNRACKQAGVQRLRHHDLRHLFATRCIESGVDIPTVSRWLGHADGGALAMKVYGHLRQEHSLAAAQKVTF